MKRIINIFFIFLITNAMFSQSSETLYNNLYYKKAIDKYKKQVKKDPYNGEALFNLANAYRLNGETSEAEYWFNKTLEFNNSYDTKMYYAQMLLTNGKIDNAKNNFQKLSLSATNQQEISRINGFINLCDRISNNQIAAGNFTIKKTSFNSGALDFSPAYYDTAIAFVSNRSKSTGSSSNNDDWTNNEYTDMFIAENPNKNEVKKFSSKLSTTFHEGSMIFTKDNKKMYFTRNDMSRNALNSDVERNSRLQIMFTEHGGKKWSKPKKININNSEYSFCHPTLSKDEDFMIIASDMPGGFGGMDLYLTIKTDDLNWSQPVNLGAEINTAGNEIFPYLDEKNKLYFSSDFHPGFGGLDIFKSDYLSIENWGKPVNMGTPLNSSRDDFGVIAKSNFSTGYLSSNRGNEDDIYSFKKLGVKSIKGKVINCQTKELIPEAQIKLNDFGNMIPLSLSNENGLFEVEVSDSYKTVLLHAEKTGYCIDSVCTGKISVVKEGVIEIGLKECDKVTTLCATVENQSCNVKLANTIVKILNICTGVEEEVTADANGQFQYPLDKNCKYRITAERGNFKTYEHFFSTKDEKGCIDKIIYLKPSVTAPGEPESIDLDPQGKPITLEKGTTIDLYNIYFDLDKYFIRSDAVPELDWVVNLMKKYPSMKVEIAAHTDSRSSKKYNITLSNNRAKSARNYIASKGIRPSRMIAKGYGEEKLKNNCADGVFCDEFKHQRNRRIEFKILEFDGGEVQSKEWSEYQK